MDQNYFKEDSKRSGFFIFVMLLMAALTLMSTGIDYDMYLQHKDLNIPTSYFYFIFGLDVLMLINILLIFMYRKIGVYLYPIVLATHFLLQDYYLSTFLYSDVTNFFVFIGFGLLVIIPRWKYYK